MSAKIGIIGGSGLSKIGIIKDIEELGVNTPFGSPSEKIILGKIGKIDVAFLSRHGKDHTIPPHKVNNRANIFALKECGVEYLISTAAVGSLKKEIKPQDFVIASQLVDKTVKRSNTFFDEGVVAHVGFADPFCKILSDLAFNTAKEEGVNVHHGTYICMEGPQFSTRAESNLYRSWGVDIIGMTLAPEAKLAREAEMCLSAICSVTDYDCWYKGKEDVSVTSVVETMKKNSVHMANIIKNLVPKIKYERTCECHNALDSALITPVDLIQKYGNAQVSRVLLKRFLK
ncbi:MAG: S-methyl-5'-thioadenosine phosphorylase [Candidatus Thermoplasmatota archaeon]|jgi:5'-methylthioadenosine phosphorylase|nr:S-methyl-5'-thioadenosine phosphorylase [Candidatus Thermoplasmatota archaeon]